MLSVWLIAVLLAPIGCKKAQEPAAAVDAPTAPTFAEEEAAASARIRAQMHAQFATAIGARDALIAGDLEGSQAKLRELDAFTLPPEIPQEWSEHFDAFQTAAARGAEAEDFAGTSDAISDLALACGGCHQAIGVVQGGDPGEPPADQEASGMHMARHQWAVDQMWMSLLGATDALWNRGVEALAVEPLHEHEVGEMPGQAEKLAEWVHQMSEFGEEAALDTEARSAYYAELIVTCAECHTVMERGPAK